MIPFGTAAKNYYDTTPERRHQTGDIWKGLPTFGLLGQHQTCSGLVITPACDLANNKSTTITYLPILTVTEYLGTAPIYATIRTAIHDVIKDRFKLTDISKFLPRDSVQVSRFLMLKRALSTARRGVARRGAPALTAPLLRLLRRAGRGGFSRAASHRASQKVFRPGSRVEGS